MITIYSSEHCPKCKMLMAKMDKKGIRYDKCMDIGIMISPGIFDLPVVKVDNEYIFGIKNQNDWVNNYISEE